MPSEIVANYAPILRRAALIGAVVLAHLLVLQFILVLGTSRRQASEIFIPLPILVLRKPVVPPSPPKEEKHKRTISRPGVSPMFAAPLSAQPFSGMSVPGAMNCIAMDQRKLSPEMRRACAAIFATRPYAAQSDTDRLAFHADPNAPIHRNGAEATLHQMRTFDPCVAAKNTPEPECISKIIFGSGN